MKSISEIISNVQKLKEEDLEFYQKLIGFFEFIGISADDLQNLVLATKNFPEMVDRVNRITREQNAINEKYDELMVYGGKEEAKKQKSYNPVDEFNAPRKELNLYGR